MGLGRKEVAHLVPGKRKDSWRFLFRNKRRKEKYYLGKSEEAKNIVVIGAGYIGVELYIRDNKEMFDELYIEKDNIESLLSFPLEWHRLNNRKASRIITKIEDLDFDNHSNYYELMDDVILKVISMRKVFKEHLLI